MAIINTRLSTDTAITVAGTLPVGAVVHKSCGNKISTTSDSIIISGAGYYKVTSNVTYTPTAAGTVTTTLYVNGTAVSASSTAGTASEPVNNTMVAVVYNRCCCNDIVITIGVNTPGTVLEIDTVVEKV